MKNKKFTILLMILAIGVWGLICYRVLLRTGTRSAKAINVANDSVNFVLPEVSDTFSIVNDYNDPFRINNVTKVKKEKIVENIPKIKTQVVKLEWPIIQFRGSINKQSSNELVALVNLNGKDNVMHRGEIKDNVQLIKIWRDSMLVGFNKEKRVISKKK